MPNYDLHKAAREGTLNQLPLDSLTPDAFLVADDAGLTPMHLAAYFGHLDQIPSSVFANEAIGLKYNDDGDNFYDVAANAGHLDQIPAAQRLAIVRGNGLIQLVGREGLVQAIRLSLLNTGEFSDMDMVMDAAAIDLALGSDVPMVAARAASMVSCNEKHLLRAIGHPVVAVATAAAANEGATSEVLRKAICHGHCLVRSAAASNPSVTPQVLSVAMLDPEKKVVFAALSNPRCTAELWMIALNHSDNSGVVLSNTLEHDSVVDAIIANPSGGNEFYDRYVGLEVESALSGTDLNAAPLPEAGTKPKAR